MWASGAADVISHPCTRVLVQEDEDRHMYTFPKASYNSHWVFLSLLLAGTTRAKHESRSHPSLQDVINLLLRCLFSSRVWLSCLGFAFIIYWAHELQQGAVCCSATGTAELGEMLWIGRRRGSWSVPLALNSLFEKTHIFSENWQNNLRAVTWGAASRDAGGGRGGSQKSISARSPISIPLVLPALLPPHNPSLPTERRHQL